MGVPAFFAWLMRKYPDALTDMPEAAGGGGAAGAAEGAAAAGGGGEGARALAGWYCDNLYLDMNGIIHPCCHPEGGKPQPGSEAEMFENVAKLLDTLVEKLRPRKLLCATAARTSASHRLLP